MAEANPLWGAPRIHGELLKLGIDVSQASVGTYLPRHRRPPSQTWRTFLANHGGQIMAADFFVVPTAMYRLLFVLVILAHERRRVVHVAVTAHPNRGPIFRSPGTRQSGDQSRSQPSAPSSPFHKSAGYTTATTVGRRSHTPLSLPGRRYRNGRRSPHGVRTEHSSPNPHAPTPTRYLF